MITREVVGVIVRMFDLASIVTTNEAKLGLTDLIFDLLHDQKITRLDFKLRLLKFFVSHGGVPSWAFGPSEELENRINFLYDLKHQI